MFYDVKDAHVHESWSVSEKLVREICETKLDVKPTTIERARRIEKFRVDKNRPLIVNSASFKEKQAILGNEKKLEGSSISLYEGKDGLCWSLRRVARMKTCELASGMTHCISMMLNMFLMMTSTKQ